jgi:flavin reductase (DIM6/NTAB) family NADH-FMN oxidoreductase RutF
LKKSIGAKTAIYPTPVLVVGTYDKEGKPNLATVAWGGVCCSDPPCVAISLREATYTHGSILERKAFTVNILPESQLAEADYYGIASGRKTDKFTATGMTPVKSDVVDAPYGKEFPLVLECKLKHVVEIGLHTQFIGEVVDAKADEDLLRENDYPDIEKLKPILYAPGSEMYYGVAGHIGDAFEAGKKF